MTLQKNATQKPIPHKQTTGGRPKTACIYRITEKKEWWVSRSSHSLQTERDLQLLLAISITSTHFPLAFRNLGYFNTPTTTKNTYVCVCVWLCARTRHFHLRKRARFENKIANAYNKLWIKYNVCAWSCLRCFLKNTHTLISYMNV